MAVQRNSRVVVACVSLLHLAPSTRYQEVIAVAWRLTWISSRKMCIRNSWSLSSQLGWYICRDTSSSSSSSWNRGVGLSQHDQRAWSLVLFWWVCSFCRVHLPLHRREQQVILTFSFSQSTLGLWSLSQLQSRIRLCLQVQKWLRVSFWSEFCSREAYL